jgi:alpha-tubulin suppressor-like RCC1 family protein
LNFTSISAGGNHACGIVGASAAYCWGQDSAGQLGDARRVNSTTPIPVFSPTGGGLPAAFNAISAGFRHTCALQSDGLAFCWGRNESGQLGTGDFSERDVPAGVAGGTRFIAISSGGDTISQGAGLPPLIDSHTCALAVNGSAWCWGSNSAGQIGNGTIGGSVAAPVPVSGGLTFTKISAGGRHTCGLTTAGSVYCWGHGSDLQLGRGGETGSGFDSGTPQSVTGGELSAGAKFTTISAGARHSCAVADDGNAYCWGSDIYGALGNTLQAAFRGFPRRVAIPR